jgi:hypothetical protein
MGGNFAEVFQVLSINKLPVISYSTLSLGIMSLLPVWRYRVLSPQANQTGALVALCETDQ